MWTEPYLETCCRAALHRLFLSADKGRPAGMSDEPCLQRLSGMALCRRVAGSRYVLTESGAARHRKEVLKMPAEPGRRSAIRTTAP